MPGKAGRLAKFRRSTSGVAAVEFALVAFPFFLFVSCILEGGLMLLTQHQIQNALQEASRQLSTRQVTTRADFVDRLCASAVTVQNCTVRMNSMVNSAPAFNTLDTPLINPLAVGPEPPTFNTGLPGQAVVAVASYDWRFIFPLMNVFGNLPDTPGVRRLTAVAAFQNEPL